MTAVLFSLQERNSFEVVKNPQSTDDTIGLINQSHSGSTGGILIAAEAPFAFPKPSSDWILPVGAWFGVSLTTGGGSDVSDVDLALGLSFSFVSGKAELSENDPKLAGSAKLLLGVVYGEVASLGPKDAQSDLQVGDPYPLGETPPLRQDSQISAVVGIGFRF